MKRVFLMMAWVMSIAVGCVVWAAYQSPATRPNIAITFLGYTNGSAAPLARFAITNFETSTVFLVPRTVEIKNVTNLWAGLSAGSLGAGASRVFTVQSPTNQTPWRMTIIVYPDSGTCALLKGMAAATLNRVGFKTRYSRSFYGFYSGWIENEDQRQSL